MAKLMTGDEWKKFWISKAAILVPLMTGGIIAYANITASIAVHRIQDKTIQVDVNELQKNDGLPQTNYERLFGASDSRDSQKPLISENPPKDSSSKAGTLRAEQLGRWSYGHSK